MPYPFYPFIYLWTFSLLPCLGYCKTVLLLTFRCIYLFKLEFSSFPHICPGMGLLNDMVTLFLVF